MGNNEMAFIAAATSPSNIAARIKGQSWMRWCPDVRHASQNILAGGAFKPGLGESSIFASELELDELEELKELEEAPLLVGTLPDLEIPLAPETGSDDAISPLICKPSTEQTI